MISDKPEAGKTYRHYKGGRYHVNAICRHTETGETMIAYQSLDFTNPETGYPAQWVRPLIEWDRPVECVEPVKRFQREDFQSALRDAP